MNTPEKFWARLRMLSPTSCWEWTGSCRGGGYGQVRWHGKYIATHQLAAMLSGIEVTNSKPHILHHCDNKICCNPSHLYAGSPQQNSNDSVERGRQPRGEKHRMAKLTEKQVRDIRKWYKAGWTQVELAKMHNVSQTMIGYIVREENWK